MFKYEDLICKEIILDCAVWYYWVFQPVINELKSTAMPGDAAWCYLENVAEWACVERRACDVESNLLKSRRLFEVNVIMNRKKED